MKNYFKLEKKLSKPVIDTESRFVALKLKYGPIEWSIYGIHGRENQILLYMSIFELKVMFWGIVVGEDDGTLMLGGSGEKAPKWRFDFFANERVAKQ